jgi:RND superfamily putative drug exporter
VAGVALALSFAMLAIIPITPFAVMAFAMGVGILLDTFLVRSALVPALVVLFGRGTRWPGRSPEYDSQDVSDPSTAPLQRQIQGRRT